MKKKNNIFNSIKFERLEVPRGVRESRYTYICKSSREWFLIPRGDKRRSFFSFRFRGLAQTRLEAYLNAHRRPIFLYAEACHIHTPSTSSPWLPTTPLPPFYERNEEVATEGTTEVAICYNLLYRYRVPLFTLADAHANHRASPFFSHPSFLLHVPSIRTATSTVSIFSPTRGRDDAAAFETAARTMAP